ncbi:MAG: bifunctional riboflavin kinase/FAD synthetase [Sulfurovum sp.]|nr:bifunctional riboflavin kinase/FAD synthetase [Sulfurovum sp.]
MKFNNNIKSIAIGSFDGMHIAHKTLIDEADAIVIIERNGGYLTPGYKRAGFSDKMCCFYHFDVIKDFTPKEFVAKLNADFPNLEKIVVGYDFHFGKKKAGNVEVLRVLCDKEVLVIEEVSIEGISVHSRTIKTYIREGNIAMANTLLGREYSIEGGVVSGQGLGKKELVPTLNLNVQAYQLPTQGVYVTRTKVRGEWLDSVSFLGHRVTTDGSYAIETHILEKDIGAVQGMVALSFVGFLRTNKKFENLEALKVQIEEDIKRAKAVYI